MPVHYRLLPLPPIPPNLQKIRAKESEGVPGPMN